MTVLQQQPPSRPIPIYEDPPVVSYYLANPAPIDAYLATCDQKAEAMREKLAAAGISGRIGKEELLARARAKGLLRDPASDR